jgi:hypothetical protein
VMDETLIQAPLLDLNVVKLQGPVVLVETCTANILRSNIIKFVFA